MEYKRYISWILVILVTVTFLLTSLPMVVLAENADEGVYSQIANPIATQEARNLYYYLQRQGSRSGFVVGAMDTSITSEFPNGNNYDLLDKTFGVKLGMYSTRYYWTSNWTTSWPNVDGNVKMSGIGFALEQEDSENGATAAKTINDVLYDHYKKGAILLIHADSMEPKAVGELLYKNGKIPLAVTKDTDYDDAIIYVDKTNPDRDLEATALFWSFVEQWADALEDLESRGVGAYLFRPFVEMNSKDFYGCTEQGKAAFRRVWQQMYDYFYNERKLKGCLLTFAPADYYLDTRSAEPFYPGSEYADVLAPTRYTDEEGLFDQPEDSNYTWMTGTGKPLGFSEFSVRTGDWTIAAGAPTGDWYYALKAMLEDYPAISMVNTWAGSAYSLFAPDNTGSGNNNGEIFLNSPYTILADQLPDFKTANITMPGLVQFYNKKSFAGAYTGWNKTGVYAVKALADAGVDLSSAKSMELQKGYGIVFFDKANGKGTAYPCLDSLVDLSKLSFIDKVRSFRVFKVEENVAFEKEVTASSDAMGNAWKVNDGYLSRWSANDDPTSWLMIDLGQSYLLNRWVVQHAGAAGEIAQYNTAAFEIQSSMDGENWETVSSVTGNVDNVSDVTVASFVARYVRLMILKPNLTTFDPNRATIAEVELYGLPVDLLTDTDDTTNPDEGVSDDADNISDTSSDTSDQMDSTDTDTGTDDTGMPGAEQEESTDNSDEEPMTSDNEDTSEPEQDTDDEEPEDSEVDTHGPGKQKVQKIVTEVYFPWWGWVLIALGVLLAAATVLLIIIKRKKAAVNLDAEA